jgi:hypothetical protein
VTPESPPIEPETSPGWRPAAERILLALLLVTVALVRFVGPDQIEPNVSVVEASNLASTEAMLLDRGPGLLALNDAGASGLALSLPTIFRVLGREPELALRLYAALGSVALVAAFYGVCRTRWSPLVSLAAAVLLAFSPWSIFFGRNGELNVFVALAGLGGIWLQRRAVERGGAQTWLRCGAVSVCGLYWHPVAIWLPLALLVSGAARLTDRATRRRIAAGLVFFVVGAAVVAVPALPSLASYGSVFGPRLADQQATAAAPSPATSLRVKLQQTVRAFFLLDPTAPGNLRYLPVGRAPLDGLTGVLLLIGIGLAIWRPATQMQALVLFLVPLLGSQLASAEPPDLGRAVVALPGLYLLVAGALDRILTSLPFRPVTSAIVLVALPAYAFVGWQGYAGWMGTSQSAQARQPAIDYDEIDAWLADERERLEAGQPLASAAEWRQANPRLATGVRTVRRPRDAGNGTPPPVAPAALRLEQTQAIQGDRDAGAPRGVAVTPSGDVFVADQAGRVSRLDPERNVLIPLPGSTPSLQQVSEIVAGADGQLLLADAERSLLVLLDPRGGIIGTLGADWGMYRPRGATVAPNGSIYVADTGRNRIVVASPDGRLLKSIGPHTSAGDLEQPTDVAVDPSGRVYVALPDSGRLTVLDDDGQVLGGWAISKADTIDGPHIAVVADGAIAITDPGQKRVWIADADGREIDSLPMTGRTYGAAADANRLFVTEPSSGRLLVFSLQAR